MTFRPSTGWISKNQKRENPRARRRNPRDPKNRVFATRGSRAAFFIGVLPVVVIVLLSREIETPQQSVPQHLYPSSPPPLINLSTMRGECTDVVISVVVDCGGRVVRLTEIVAREATPIHVDGIDPWLLGVFFFVARRGFVAFGSVRLLHNDVVDRLWRVDTMIEFHRRAESTKMNLVLNAQHTPSFPFFSLSLSLSVSVCLIHPHLVIINPSQSASLSISVKPVSRSETSAGSFTASSTVSPPMVP